MLSLLLQIRICFITFVQETTKNLRILNINPSDIIAIGLTNQRETTILWNKTTGKPLYNGIGECYGVM